MLRNRLDRRRWTAFRWILPLVIPLGGYLTSDRFEGADFTEYAFLTVVSTVACALYVWLLKKPGEIALPYWGVFVIIYVGHYLQFYWLLLGVNSYFWLDFIVENMGAGLLLDAYSQATVALSVAASATTVMLAGPVTRSTPLPRVPMVEAARIQLSKVALICGGVLAVVTALLMYKLNIGVVGLEAHLPFRLAGFIHHSRRTLAPALMLTVVLVSDGSDRLRKYFWAAVGLLIVNALSDMIVSTSRASLAVMGIRLCTLFVAQKALNARRLQVIAIALIGTILLYPFVSSLRSYRSTGSGVSEALGSAQVWAANEADAAESKFAVLSRFCGVIALLPIINSHKRVSTEIVIDGVVGRSGGVTAFNTTQIAGLSAGDKIGVAPSLLGWFYLVGGEVGQAVGVAVLIVLCGLVWQRLARVAIRTRPVAQALIGAACFQALAEGDLEGLVIPLVAALASIVIVEWLLRFTENSVGRDEGHSDFPIWVRTGSGDSASKRRG